MIILPERQAAGSTTRPNLLCVQLYTETNDYKLQVSDHMGISMYVNRDMTADEIVFQSPVGPSQQSALLLENSTTESLTPVRQTFADRFLEWQSMYKTQRDRERAETQELTFPLFHLEDFMSNHPHPKTTAASSSSTTVTEKERQHSMSSTSTVEYTIELRKNDFLIVEFIANSNDTSQTTTATPTTTTTLLPPERRFDILPYDEAICWDGEDDYNPALCQRPPTLCEHDSRTIELPAHYTNHACGSSATTYDTYQLATTSTTDANDEPPSSSSSSSCCPIVAPAQSEEVQRMLERYVRTHEFPNSLENVMTTHRALRRGEEILTDYVLWHWSNMDYIPNSRAFRVPPGYLEDFDWDELTTRFQRAAVVLGNTKELWEAEGNDSNPLYDKAWKDLSPKEQGAAKILGYNRQIWNSEGDGGNSDDDEDDTNDDHDHEDWERLPEKKRNAAALLGYTKILWDTNQEPPISDHMWYHLTSEIKEAAITLGYNQQLWDGALMPWFDCICGDANCHSADGFRGVKYFSLEEQKRLYWVSSQWMQNQIDWKIYQLEREEKRIK